MEDETSARKYGFDAELLDRRRSRIGQHESSQFEFGECSEEFEKFEVKLGFGCVNST